MKQTLKNNHGGWVNVYVLKVQRIPSLFRLRNTSLLNQVNILRSSPQLPVLSKNATAET